MNEPLGTLLFAAAISVLFTLGLAAILMLASRPSLRLPDLGDAIIRAPLLDLIIAMLTWLPWLAAGIIAGWLGVLGTILGQCAAMLLWTTLHELAHRDSPEDANNGREGGVPRINRYLSRTYGRWRNHLALWLTLIALPVLWQVRIVEIIAYPWLVWLLRFPRYRQGEWINVSRHKFEGLIGHDLIWCLYCDWMTGVYSLAGEMLRNVESFWCPIRFYDNKKCENCKLDFPDIEGGWVAAGGTMQDVQKLMEEKYPSNAQQPAWFGHPVRLTVKGTSRAGT